MSNFGAQRGRLVRTALGPPGRAGEDGMRAGRQKRVVAAVAAIALAIAGVAVLLEEDGPQMSRADASGAARSTDLGNLQLPRRDGLSATSPPEARPPGDAVIAPPPEAFSEPAAPAPPPPQELRGRFRNVVPEGGTWAVLVGINDYPGGSHDLRSALNDVGDVNEALARMGVPGSRRLVIKDGQATADVIRTSMEWLIAHASPDATVVFFYAGHVRKVGGQEAIVAADGKIVLDQELGQQMTRLRARQAWIGIAACYGGGFTEMLGPNRILTAAAPANRLAYENLDFGRSYMVEYMIRRGWLGQQAGITVEEAFEYARRELSASYPNRVPVQIDNFQGMLDLRPQSGAARPTPAPNSQPAPSSPPPSSPPGGGGSGGAPPEGGDDSNDDDSDSCSTLTGGVVACGGD